MKKLFLTWHDLCSFSLSVVCLYWHDAALPQTCVHRCILAWAKANSISCMLSPFDIDPGHTARDQPVVLNNASRPCRDNLFS